MFRKILDQVKNVNLDKIKKDAQIHTNRLIFNSKKAKKELQDTWSKKNLFKNFPSYETVYKNIKKNLKPDSIDKKYSQKVDDFSEKFEKKASSTINGFTKLKDFSLKFPSLAGSWALKFGKESKETVKEGYFMSKMHIKKYLKDNQKYFKYRKEQFGQFFDKSKKKLLLIGGGAIFLYGLGSNIPHAIVTYKLAKEIQELKAKNSDK